MKKNNLKLAVLLAASTVLGAQENNPLGELETLLENASDIATKKSLNVDYLPSVVSVIDSQTFREAGIQTLGEALDMLPGVQMQLSPMGYIMPTVRGFKNPNAYLSDKIKILIDGVAINNEVGGSSSFYMDFPMQLVRRIEVLRGPNSTMQGSGAFYGTVNVITKLGSGGGENQVFLGTGSYSHLTAGANVYTLADGWKIFADGYIARNSKSLRVEEEIQETDEAKRDASVGFKAVNGGFEFLTRYKRNVYGNFYSFEEGLDPIPENPKEHINSYFLAQAAYKTNLSDVGIETKIGFSQRELDEGANIVGITSVANRFATVGIEMQEGFYFTEKMKEQNFEAEAIFTLPEMGSHEIVGGGGVRHIRLPEDTYFNSVENAITQNLAVILASPSYDSFRYREENEPAFWADPTTSFIKADQSRTVGYFYVQDLISLHDDVDLILGARLDDYSDIGTSVSQRAAIVYRANDSTVLKLLYGSAFRAPTFTEAYANGHINYRAGDAGMQPEETDTYEAVAIYTPNLSNRFSINFFYSKLKNVIDLEEYSWTIPGYQNCNDRTSKGVEFEYNYHAMAHDLYFNASYIDTGYTVPPDDDSPLPIDQSMPDISKVMLKAMYIYRPSEALSLGTAWRYFSRTTQSQLAWITEDGTDTTVRPQHIFDETITYRFSHTSELRFTVKNLFDADVRLPSYYYNTEGGIAREGRNFFLNYVQTF